MEVVETELPTLSRKQIELQNWMTITLIVKV